MHLYGNLKGIFASFPIAEKMNDELLWIKFMTYNVSASTVKVRIRPHVLTVNWGS